MLRLIIRVDGHEQSFDTELAAITFGRAAENSIQVTDPKSSRNHCRLEQTPAGWKILDLESSNGTAVNGAMVNSRLLKPGDVISIGAFQVVFSPAVAPASAAAPAPGSSKSVSDSSQLRVVHAHRAIERSNARESAAVASFIKVAVIAAVLLVGAVVAINYVGLGGGAEAQRVALAEAQKLADKGDLDMARKMLQNLLSNPTEAGVNKRAKELLADVEGKIASRDAEADKARTARMSAEEAARRAAEFSNLFAVTTAAADSLMAEERYGDALDEWKQFQLECTAGEYKDKSDRRMKEVVSKAEAAWSLLQERANRLSNSEKYDEAAALVSSSLDKFRGTRFHADAQDKLAAINRLAGVTAAYAGAEGGRLSQKTEDALMTVSDFVRAQRYADALSEMDKLLPGAPESEKPSLEARRSEIASQAALFGKLIDAVNKGAFGAHPQELGGGMKATLTKATNESLEIAFRDVEGKGGASQKKWHQVAAKDMLAYFNVLDLTIDDQLALASFCYANGLPEDAGEILSVVMKRDPAREQTAWTMIARYKGVPVPSSGFVWYAGGWYTQAELQHAKLDVDARKAAQQLAQIDAKKAAEGRDTAARLLADGSAGPDRKSAWNKMFTDALKNRRTAILRQLQNSGSVVTASTLRDLKKELKRRREVAIKVIYDKDVYPDADHGKVGQPKVDAAVNAVRELWDNPLQTIGTLSTGISDLIAAADQTDRWLSEFGSSTSAEEQAEIQQLLAKVNEALSLKNFCMDGGERSMLEKYRAIMAYNERHGGFESEEKECIRKTNEYRFMMGRQALEAHDLLGKAARAHSVEMGTMNYFAHESPTPGLRSPSDRVRKEGYGGSVGENIAMGMSSGDAACLAWYNSSGHHRNMLSDGWNQIGIGKSGSYWTENLGRGGSAMSKEDKTAKGGDKKEGSTTSGGKARQGVGGSGGGKVGGVAGGSTAGGKSGGVAGGSTGGGGC